MPDLPPVGVLPDEPFADLDAYRATGGGDGLHAALERSQEDVIAEVRAAGLRGRGGAGFPTGVKWGSVREAGESSTVYLVCNGAEGEPGTFKDRALLYRNPYQLLEGILIARYAVGAARCYVGVKERFTRERERLAGALDEVRAAGWTGAEDVEIIAGPDEYLYGEESAMLEVVEGKLPLPRILPPYMQGLFSTMQSPNPTVVNNVETLSHVAHILRHGADWFRSEGTTEAPGTLVFTLLGDVANAGVYELPLGTSLRTLVEDIGEATDVMAIYSGTSNPVIMPDLLDLPMDWESFSEAGLGMGSGGFMVYSSERDIVQVCWVLSRFLAVESCGQCLACKLGNTEISERLERIVNGRGTHGDIEEIRKRCVTVTDGNRCYLPVGAALTVASTLEKFEQEFEAHLGRATDPDVAVLVPKILDVDHDTGEVTLDASYGRKRSDWSYAPVDEPA